MARLFFSLLFTILLANAAWAAPNPHVDTFLKALQQADYPAAAESIAHPSDTSETERAAELESLINTLIEYHDKIGVLEQADIKVSREGNYQEYNLSGGSESFAMEHPPTNFARVGAKFAKAGLGFITFMLADIDGEERVVFVKYEYPGN